MAEKKNPPPYVAIVSLLVMVVTTAVLFSRSPGERPIPVELRGVLWPAPKPLRPFSLVDHHNKPFDQQRLKGQWTLLFIGYTSCPDICPTTMNVLAGVAKRLEQAPSVAAGTQVVFLSVDPQRDSLEHLAGYMGYFNKDFLGVTGDSAQIDSLVRQAGAAYMKEPADASGNYLIGHSGSVFLIGPEGAVLGAFPPPHDPETMAQQYRQIRDL